ncbi:MAG: hypothetical protein ACR2JA_07025 [Hydrogenophaga sp.]|uniref:hypothetical protein n=1 Tax=Hydrogenophaga sp. TaxID=1904254 RepID=UPI003D9AF0D3
MTVKRTNIVANFEARSVALVASWTLAGAALAQSAPPPPASRDGKAVSALFQQADQNGDGLISRSKAASVPRLEAAFDRLDSDRNGSLSPDEFDRGTPG